MSLQALLDATPDGGTCVIPAGDHTIPEGVGLVVPHGVAAVDATGATIRVVGADGQRSTARRESEQACRDQLDQMRVELERMRGDLASTRRELEDTRRELEETRREVHGLRALLDALGGSDG